jgi:hypothetical protein
VALVAHVAGRGVLGRARPPAAKGIVRIERLMAAEIRCFGQYNARRSATMC